MTMVARESASVVAARPNLLQVATRWGDDAMVAILQQRDRRFVDANIEEESVDGVQEIERATVGKMQVKQAIRVSELMLKSQQQAAVADAV